MMMMDGDHANRSATTTTDGDQPVRFPPQDGMISFTEARGIIGTVAGERAGAFRQREELLSLDHAVGRTAKYDIRSPIDTPTFDSAAIEGYAVISAHTAHAKPDAPVHLLVMGTMGPGDVPLVINDEVVNGLVPCVEIMTGAAFPVARSSKRNFDACVPWERARRYGDKFTGTMVEITSPPLTSWHKRLKGGDFRRGDMILESGTLIVPKHVMALASVGVNFITTTRTVRAAVLTIGSELIPPGTSPAHESQFKIPDANGPYLTAALREMGADVAYLGAYPDNADLVGRCLGDQLQAGSFDVIISTGGVSSGNQSHMPACIARLDGQQYFHYVAMKPGHTSLFASLPLDGVKIEHSSPSKVMRGQDFQDQAEMDGQVRMVAPVLFCLPGNPVASAACFRFLVTPYIRTLGSMMEEQSMTARVAATPEMAKLQSTRHDSATSPWVVEGSPQVDIFRQACVRSNSDGVTVEVSRERNPAKTSPFASSNCWVHVPRGHHGVRQGDVAKVYPFCSPKS